MAAALGGQPAQGIPWPGGCPLEGLADPETPGLGHVQAHGGGALQPATPFGGVGGAPPVTGSPFFHNSAPLNVNSPAPKGMEQTSVAPGGPVGDVGLQADTPEGAPVDPWMTLPSQQVQQQFYCESQPMLQQQIQQQHRQGLPQGPHDGQAPGVRLGDSSQWAAPMEYTTDGQGRFGYGSPCMLPAQVPPPPYAVSPMPTGPFVGDQPVMTQPHMAAWQAGDGGQQDPMQGSPPAASPFGMCVSASPGHQGRLAGSPEIQGNAGPWYPMQQQQVGEHAASSASYCGMPEAPAKPKATGKSSRQNKSGGARRRGDSAADGGPGGSTTGGQATTRPAKFFKQHSPGKAVPKPKGKAGGLSGAPLGERGPKGPADGPLGCAGPSGQAGGGAAVSEDCKASSGPLQGGQAEPAAPKPAPRSRALKPSEVMAKMYFHRKKEAWRAELLIEGTKKQKSFSCRLYGYERARLMCEWARKFVLRTSRLPTDEETCTSLASLMKVPLPSQVPSGLPCMSDDYSAHPQTPESPFPPPRGAQGPLIAKAKNLLLAAEQQAAAATAMVGSGTAIGGGSGEAGTSALSGTKGSHDPQGLGAGLSKKRKESAKAGEATIKVRKGSGAQGSASSKKGNAPKGPANCSGDPAFMGRRRVDETDMLGVAGSARSTCPTESKTGDSAQQLLPPYFAFTGSESGTTPYETNVAACGGSELQELPQAGAPLTQGSGSLPGRSQQQEAPGAAEFRPGDLDQRAQEANPWFEELEQLKKVSRPKGGRAKRFNVGKKPFSGVRGIYFQQGLWKVKYRGEQEEAMKLFPYSPGDEKDMKTQFELARSFLRQVIDKGRHLHDSDGEGLSEDEPAWLVRGNSSKWTYRKDMQLPSSKSEQLQSSKSPNANLRKTPPANKGPRRSASGEAFRGGASSVTEDWQGPASASNYFLGPPVHPSKGFLSRGLPFSATGVTFSPHPAGFSPWAQRALAYGQAGEFQGDAAWGKQPGSEPERQNSWSNPPDMGVPEAAPGRPANLCLPMISCGGVFTTADSPMSHQASLEEKSAFPHECSTGFSAVTTTVDEAMPLGPCSGTNDPNDTAAPGMPPKPVGARYSQSYFYCQTTTTQAEEKAPAAASSASFPAEGHAPVAQPMNLNVQTPEMNLPSSGFPAQPRMQSPCATSASCHFPLTELSDPSPPFQPSGGTPKGTECFLQFRPFADQHPRHLETSLGEELLSVASYPCSFGSAIDGCQSAVQQLGEGNLAFPPMEASESLAVGQGQPDGRGGSRVVNAQIGPWGLGSPLASHRTKEEVLVGCAAVKPEPLGYGGAAEPRGEARDSRRPIALPWVVVRPREEEEKALTPLAGHPDKQTADWLS